MKRKIAVIPGDGIGPEVTREGVKVLAFISERSGLGLEFVFFDWGADAYLATGVSLPAGALDDLRQNGPGAARWWSVLPCRLHPSSADVTTRFARTSATRSSSSIASIADYKATYGVSTIYYYLGDNGHHDSICGGGDGGAATLVMPIGWTLLRADVVAIAGGGGGGGSFGGGAGHDGGAGAIANNASSASAHALNFGRGNFVG